MAPPKGFIPWNKGRNKDNDPIVALTAAKNCGQKRTEEQRRKMGEAVKRSGQRIWNKNPDRDAQHLKNLLIKRMRSMIERTLVRFGTRKEGHTHEQLGYSPIDLRKHLESLFREGMNWKNHGRGPERWHIDHIRSISSFSQGSPASVVNSLQNLQPLWEEENLRKG